MRAEFWIVIALIGAGTQALRLVPMLAHGRIETPRVVKRLLAHLPAAALTALAIPGSLYAESGSFDIAPLNIAGALVALIVARRTRSIIWSLVAGMATLWVLEALIGA